MLVRTLLPALAEMTPPSLATFVEEPSENTFPALPVRARGTCGRVGPERVVDDNWPAPIELNLALDAPPLQLRLAPTARSPAALNEAWRGSTPVVTDRMARRR